MPRLNLAALGKLSPEERAAIAPELAELEARTERNPLIGLYPYPCKPCHEKGKLTCAHSKQHKFLISRDRRKAFFGGNQSGKTTAGISDDLIQCVDRDALPPHLRKFKQYEPPFKCRIGTPDLMKTMDQVQEKLRELVPVDQLLGGSWESAYSISKRTLRFKNGSYIEFLSYDQERNKWGGSTLHRVHFDEEPPKIIYDEAALRVMKHGGDVIFTMTPHDGITWMADAIYERRFEDGVTVVEVDMDDNPYLTEEAKRVALEGLTEEELRQRKAGKFTHIGGLVLGEFDEDLHVIDPVPPAHIKGMNVVVGIDPGLVVGGVVWIAFDRENVGLLFDELYLKQQTLDVYISEIRRKNAEWGIEPDFYVIDPSARNRSHINAENVESELQRAGIMTIPGQNMLEAGYFQIKRRLQSRPVGLLICRNCVNWLWERARLKRKPMDDGSFAVVPGNDHLMDPTRYVVMTRVWGPPIEMDKKHRRGFTPNAVDPYEYEPQPEQYGPMGSMG